MEEAPDHFMCPISHQVMEYPFITETGHSYEYSAITKWLSSNQTDPLTGQRLASKQLSPNHRLRAMIQDWLEHPDHVAFRSQGLRPPPAEAYQIPQKGLERILRYKGKVEREKGKGKQAEKPTSLPEPFSAYGFSYSFSHGRSEGSTMISCTGGDWVQMPEKQVFSTPRGLVFYDPKETLDAYVLPGTDRSEPCRYTSSCNRECGRAHPFVCLQGFRCATQGRGCRFLHPSASSATVGSTPCKYKTSCSRKDCTFAHPDGRMAVPRSKATVWVTHSHNLQRLQEPMRLELELPEAATCFQVQGEFVCSFQPYAGSWAKNHFKVVTVHRFVPRQCAYQVIGNYSLDRHYCNAAMAVGRYLIFSFWPYEEEAMRTIWGCLRISRAMEKELKVKMEEIRGLKVELEDAQKKLSSTEQRLHSTQQRLSSTQQELYHTQQNLSFTRQSLSSAKQSLHRAHQEKHAAREEAAAARRQAKESREQWRSMQRRQENERNERLRLRDPIHIYALAEGSTGLRQEDWQLVLDYHKGAHGIELTEPRADGTQEVQFTVHDLTLRFDLVVPSDPRALGSEPLRPSMLCPDF